MGPELEVTGFGCEDHFFERDTVQHSWECLKDLIENGYTDDIVCDIGMPVYYRGPVLSRLPSTDRYLPWCDIESLFNCRVLVLNRKVLLIRPKISICNDGNYREKRQQLSHHEEID